MLQLLVLERVGPDANVHRHYVLLVEPTLFDGIGLRRERGRPGQRGGALKLELRDDFAGAKEAL